MLRFTSSSSTNAGTTQKVILTVLRDLITFSVESASLVCFGGSSQHAGNLGDRRANDGESPGRVCHLSCFSLGTISVEIGASLTLRPSPIACCRAAVITGPDFKFK